MDSDGTQSFSFSDDEHFHEQCEEFITAWQAYLEGRSPAPGPPAIREFLGDTEELAATQRCRLFEELLDIDLNYRWEQDIKPAPTCAAYEREFPEFRDEVKRAFMIGRYEILGLLGSGAFGCVYRARDPDLERKVAIKVPHPNRVVGPEDVDAYLREARNVANLDHPNIVPVFDYGEDPKGRCFVVSKLIEGSNLKTLITGNRCTIEETTRLIATLAEALHHAHQKGLVHRDIKPANILIDSSETPYLVDFGLAIRDVDLGDSSSQGGTPHYMSPEQARGEGHRVDPRSDVFSLGTVLYELMTGKQPFPGSDVVKVMQHIADPDHDAWPPNSTVQDVPTELGRICLKCLAKRKDDRYASAFELAADLQRFLDDLQHGVSVRPNSKHTKHSSTGWIVAPSRFALYVRDASMDWLCILHNRNAVLRVACPVFLKIGVGSRLCLIRVPDEAVDQAFIPIGGILKHRSPLVLDAIEFQPDAAPYANPIDVTADLRGCIRRKRLPCFRRWLKSGEDRESDEECLRREIVEELGAIGVPNFEPFVQRIRFRCVRQVEQKPTPTPGYRYAYQYRRTVILEPCPDCDAGKDLADLLGRASVDNPHLRLVSPTELVRNRMADGQPIASNSCYLVSDRPRLREPGEL